MSDLLCLGYDIQRSMFNILEDVRNSVRTVKIHIALGFAHKSHVTHRLEELPDRHKVLHYTNIRASLNIKVSSIEVSTYIKARNKFKSLVLGIRGRSLGVKIEVIRVLRSLKISLLERLTMPYAVSFVHEHVIHVNRHPYIGSSIRNLIVYSSINDEVVGLHITILKIVHTWLTKAGEVKLGIIILVVRSPHCHLSRISLR